MRLVGDARYCASRRATSIFVRALPNFAAGLVCVALQSWFGSEFPTCAAPTLPAHAIARRSDDVQPTAILGAMGVIATLMLLWVGIAASLPG